MSKGNVFEADILKLIFNATAISNLADNASASPLTSLYVALHTADPGEAGVQTTSEASYPSYARVAVTRDSSNWTVATAGDGTTTVKPANAIEFPECSSTSTQVITHFSIGTASGTSAGKILYFGSISPSIQMAQGVLPRLTNSSSIMEN